MKEAKNWDIALGSVFLLAKYVFLFWSLLALLLASQLLIILISKSVEITAPVHAHLGLVLALLAAVVLLMGHDFMNTRAQARLKSGNLSLALNALTFIAIGLSHFLDWEISPGFSFYNVPTNGGLPGLLFLISLLVVAVVVIRETSSLGEHVIK